MSRRINGGFEAADARGLAPRLVSKRSLQEFRNTLSRNMLFRAKGVPGLIDRTPSFAYAFQLGTEIMRGKICVFAALFIFGRYGYATKMNYIRE